jgi:hypothetical protein
MALGTQPIAQGWGQFWISHAGESLYFLGPLNVFDGGPKASTCLAQLSIQPAADTQPFKAHIHLVL